jgi:hypothetical protein
MSRVGDRFEQFVEAWDAAGPMEDAGPWRASGGGQAVVVVLNAGA